MFENQITIENRPVLEEYLNGFEYKGSSYSFTALYMWRDINQFSWQILGDHLCLSGISHLELDQQQAFLFMPLTKNGVYEPRALRETILEAREIFRKKGQDFNLRLVPIHMLEQLDAAFPGEMRWLDDRPNYDYIYLTQDLIELKGRDYHAKKNHLNYFLEHYPYEYRRMDSSMAEEAMEFIRTFNRRKGELSAYEMELLLHEEEAMDDVFRNIEAVGYLTGAIYIDGKLEALSLGGALGRKTVTVHVEKANVEYRGLYQAINNEFCKHQASHVKYINREEDMGLPGLRKAKLSYRPVKLLENYIVVFK
ncbi:MAG: phosphatidylglycerol lysyltransferase domain-containing protein [Bacillota bacterium]|nr:phosphatidylglycerol lysyltransferase domain-containing protein [Bacillota bacterium]